MLKVTLKGLLAHKRRLASTFLAVFFGVAFLAGTLMLSDTISQTFDDLFADVYRDTDAVVRSSSTVAGEFGGDDIRGRIDASLVDEVADVDGVAEAEGSVQGYAQIIGSDGEALGNPAMGAPTFGGDWGEFDELNPFDLVDGEAPAAEDEIVIDRKSALDGDLSVGDRTRVLTQSGPIDVTVVGIAKFGEADSPGGASFALFTQEAAEQYVGEPGMIDAIVVAAAGGVSQDEVRDRIAAAMPDGVEVVTGAEITAETQDDLRQALSFFNIFLGVFVVVALVVSVFSIYNTFSIIVAQRTREMALVRAVGASRRQVLGSVLGEAVVVGVLASLAGLVGGAFMVYLLKGLLGVFGVDIPASGLVLKPITIVWSLLIGLLVTMLSGVWPAVRASRIPPVAALRDVSIDRVARLRLRTVLGVGLVVLGAAAAFTSASGSGNLFASLGGVLLVFVGTFVLGPVVAGPLGRLLGVPVRRVRGFTGRLAQENSARNPRRTANTAAALLIGVGIVGFFTVISTSLKNALDTIIDDTVTGDFVIDSGTFGPGQGGLSPTLADDLNGEPEIGAATGLRFGRAEIDGTATFLTAVDPDTFGEVVDIEVSDGDLADLGRDGIAVARDADDGRLAVGDTVEVRFAGSGAQELTVVAVYDRSELTGDYVIEHAAYEASASQQFDNQVYVTLSEGTTAEEGRAVIESAAERYPQAEVQDQEEFKESQAASFNQILGLIYAMLAFAIVIALMGIANTLWLSVHERTHELGLLRAVGMTRAQLRASVRWESVIIAVFGTLGGLAMAVFLGWITVTAANEEALTFVLPVGALAFIVLLSALAGVLAGLLPAVRAARLDVLRAIAYE